VEIVFADCVEGRMRGGEEKKGRFLSKKNPLDNWRR
jgi:hypothetical protein